MNMLITKYFQAPTKTTKIQQIAYNNFITDENKFILFQNLPNETISILSQVLSKSFEYEQNNKFIDSLSHFAIQKNKDYFNEQQMEFQVENNQSENFVIGLVSKKYSQNDYGYFQYLSCHLINQNGYLQLNNRWGQTYKIKYQEMIDYPDYEFVLELEDQYKQKLIQEEDLSLYIGLWNSTKIILKEAYQVDQFANYY
ncbi:hypothetical protein ABPG72_020824 [Tetrahymena utriculariae]